MNITFIIHTFKRPDCLKRLQDSIKEFYPDVKTIVYDDTEYDRGLSWGRNYLVSQVKTKYFLLLDDDFVFTDKTKIEKLYNKVEKGYDLVAGSIEENDEIKHYEGRYELIGDCLKYIPSKKEPFHFVYNFFVGRTKTFKKYKWDEELKLAEHTAFFFEHKDLLKIGYLKDVSIKHLPERSQDYQDFRLRGKQYFRKWADKKGIVSVIDYNGNLAQVKPIKIKDVKVSIVIPVWGEYTKYLDECIENVKQQTFKEYEIIIVKDKTDLPSARNEGIRRASGKYILCLDVDDKIHPLFIEKTIGKDDIVSVGQKMFGQTYQLWTPKEHPTFEDFLLGNQIHCCSLFKKEIWEKIGGFDEDMKDGYEDWDFWLRATNAGYTITTIQETLFMYRQHPNSMIKKTVQKHDEIYKYIISKI